MIKSTVKVHLGCGLNTPSDWINIDASWNAKLAKFPWLRKLLKKLHVLPNNIIDIPWDSNILIRDIRKPLPFKDGSVSVVYASHVLEHLYLKEAESLLKECFRILKKGGILRIVVPDLKVIMMEYVNGINSNLEINNTFNQADRLNMRLLLRHTSPPVGNIFYRIYASFKDFHSHKWMYDAQSLIENFNKAGFVNASEMEYHKTAIYGIENIELKGRFLDNSSLIVEGIKL